MTIPERLARSLPDIPDEETHRAVWGDDEPYLDAPEEWFTSPRELAEGILANLPADMVLTDIGRLARALPDWMVEHPGSRSEDELRLIIAGTIVHRLREQS